MLDSEPFTGVITIANLSLIPVGSPSHGGDVKVCVLDINQSSLPTPFTLFLLLFLSYGPFTCISFSKPSQQLSTFSLCSPSLMSALLVLSTIYLFLTVSLNDFSHSGELRTQKLKYHLVRTQSLNVLPLKAWSRSVYSHTCYAYCREFFPCLLFLPFQSIHLHFFQNLSQFFPVLALANTGSCVSLQNKIGHPAGCRFPC